MRFFVYYESLKRELKTKPLNECRCKEVYFLRWDFFFPKCKKVFSLREEDSEEEMEGSDGTCEGTADTTMFVQTEEVKFAIRNYRS